MAKIDLKFIDKYSDKTSLKVVRKKVELFTRNDDVIIISLYSESSNPYNIRLDKSTAIKFAKTLRTEINKIES